jgi:hypothetical protein
MSQAITPPVAASAAHTIIAMAYAVKASTRDPSARPAQEPTHTTLTRTAPIRRLRKPRPCTGTRRGL